MSEARPETTSLSPGGQASPLPDSTGLGAGRLEGEEAAPAGWPEEADPAQGPVPARRPAPTRQAAPEPGPAPTRQAAPEPEPAPTRQAAPEPEPAPTGLEAPGPTSALAPRALDGLPRWAHFLVRQLDDVVRIPGTQVGVGWDALVGLAVPAVGDGLTGLGSVSLLLLALRQRVPTATLIRMVIHIALDVALGCLPVVGDVFDLFWRSNRRNLRLLERCQAETKPHATTGDYLVAGAGIGLAVLAAFLPLLWLYVIGTTGVVAIWRLVQALFGEG